MKNDKFSDLQKHNDEEINDNLVI